MGDTLVQQGKVLTWTNGTAADVVVNEVVPLGNRIGIAQVAIAIGDAGALAIAEVHKLPKVTGTGDWAPGTKLFWDNTADNLTKVKTTGYYAGILHETALDAATTANVNLGIGDVIDAEAVAAVPELDCETGEDTATHILIPAVENINGLLMGDILGEITEVFAGDTEDQGVITIEDSDANALATLTPTNAGADAIGDFVLGYARGSVATGDVAKSVAAGKGVQARVTTPTTGASAAGKMKVHLANTIML